MSRIVDALLTLIVLALSIAGHVVSICHPTVPFPIKHDEKPLLYSQFPKLLSGIATYWARTVDRVIHRLHIRKIRRRVEFVIDDRFVISLKIKTKIRNCIL
jgi:hypothetical protein